jgi:peptidoglycan biosynthesis protein MviN/MurJ (putative lipid II flippase)
VRLQTNTELRTLSATGLVEFEDVGMNERAEGLQRLGRYSGVAVALSLVACYGTLALVLLLATAGITLEVHEGVWATAIVVFAWIAVLAMGVNIPLYRSFSPFILADMGALLISWVMFVNYSRGLEILGFAMLAAAAMRDRYLRKRAPALGREQGVEL